MRRVEVFDPSHLTEVAVAGATAAALGMVGCAHQQQTSGESKGEEKSAEQKKIDKLEARIEELERTNGRLSVRVDEMEDELFLLQDRVQANRLTLQRRKNKKAEAGRSGSKRGTYIDSNGTSRNRRERARKAPQKETRRKREGRRAGRARAPEPEPDTRYSGRGRQGGDHPVTRIPLSPEQSRAKGNDRRKGTDGTGSSSSDTSGSTTRETEKRRETKTAAGTDDRKGAPADTQTSAGSNGEASDSEVPSTDDDRKQGEPNKKVVITEKEFQKFARRVEQNSDDSDGASTGREARGPSTGTDKTAEKRVTDENIQANGENVASDGEGDDSASTSEASATDASESGSGAGSEASTAPDAPPPNVESAEEAFDGKQGLDLYKASLGKYRNGEFAVALRGFEKFMEGDPRRDYRDNGLYWIGECQFGLGAHDKAIEYFQRVIDEHPEGNKVPDAMLKMALGYRELGMNEKARSVLEKLTQRYPTTNAGQLGEKKLSNFES